MRSCAREKRMNSSCGEASSSIRSVGLFLIVCCVTTKRAPPSIIIHMRLHASYRSVSFGAQRAHSDAIIRNRKHTTIIFIIECFLSRRIAIKFVCAAIAALCDVRWYHDGWDRPWEFMREKNTRKNQTLKQHRIALCIQFSIPHSHDASQELETTNTQTISLQREPLT